MNVQDIITRIRRTFGDEAAVQVSDDDVIRWINDGQVEIIKKKEEALQVTSFVNLVANQASYTLPADLLQLRTLRYKYNDMLSFKVLKYASMQQFDEIIDGWDGTFYTAGRPSIFTVYAGSVNLFPVPDTSVTSGLKILYSKQPTTIVTSADALSLPLVYHNTLVKYCMWQASLLDEDHEVGMMYQANFNEDADLLKNRETQEPVATYPTITVLADDI